MVHGIPTNRSTADATTENRIAIAQRAAHTSQDVARHWLMLLKIGRAAHAG